MVDGKFGWTLKETDGLLVEASDKPLLLVSSPHKGYFTILRNKLNWGGRTTDVPLPPELAGWFIMMCCFCLIL